MTLKNASESNSLFYEQLQKNLTQSFPKTSKLISDGQLPVDWTHLISPQEVALSKQSFDKMQNSVQEFFKQSRKSQTADGEIYDKIPHHSVLMSYDFHSNEQGEAKLIEINTNASGFLIGALALASQDKTHSVSELPEIHSLKKSFLKELQNTKPSLSSDQNFKVAIVDDDIPNQKMKIEFFLYKELFEEWGWTVEICEAKDLTIHQGRVLTPSGLTLDLIYNRSTDFYLTDPHHAALNEAWKTLKTVVTPQPKEYDLLADKKRLIEWQKTQSQQPEALREVLLPAFESSDFLNSEEIWKKRKNFFFKPKSSFGGKSTYRGQSISRKVFDRMLGQDPIIQEYFPPQKKEKWKFDIRCFAYQGEVQMVLARLYQGQVTNFSTIYGGFCPVHLKS